MKKIKLKIAFVLISLLVVHFVTATFGPIDTFPRLQQSASSPDGAWRFEIYRRKVTPLNPLADSEIVFRVIDVKSNKISEAKKWKVAWWIDRGKEYKVRFEPGWIILDEFWVIDKTSLDVRMCPLLECLKQGE